MSANETSTPSLWDDDGDDYGNNVGGEDPAFPGHLGYDLATRVSIVLVLSSIIALTIAGNVVVMLAVWRVRSMRTLSNAFVLSLAVADMLVGVGVMPWAVVVQWGNGKWQLGRPFCLIWLSCDVYFSTASIAHLACLAVDRYLAICTPFRYPLIVTRASVGAMLLACWTLPSFISFVPIMLGLHLNGIEEHTPPPDACFLVVNAAFALVCSLIAFFLPLGAIVFCYWHVFGVARMHASKIRALHVGVVPEGGGEGGRLWAIQRDTKAAKTLALVVGAFSLCYLPFFTMNVLDPWFDYRLDPTPGQKVWLAITWLGYCNSTLNPWIYYASNRNFRAAIRRILGCGYNSSSPPATSYDGNRIRNARTNGVQVQVQLGSFTTTTTGTAV